MVHPAAIHPLTPGSPAYALLKVGAVGSIFALRLALSRRDRAQEDAASHEEPAPDQAPAPDRTPAPHPVSRKRNRRRR